ncbi:MAG: serine/threonine-protein kinase [Polyangiaceae bacterium]
MVGLQGYKILESIGSGGMGSVYAAEREGTGERVAIKFVNSPDTTINEHLKARMAREAQAVSRLASPHLVRVFEVGQDHETGLTFLVMELLPGEDLQHLLDRAAPLAPSAALAIVAQACAGLQVAHEAHVIHRDVKPANLHLTRGDGGEITVKVLDFGVAKVKMDEALGAGAHALTRTGSILGSPLYMSPEQARGAKTIDHRADVWSLGVVLYHALAGRTPFQDVEALGELIMTICQKPAPLVQDFAPWISPGVAAIVHKALRIDPAERFPSAAAMGAEIAKLLPEGSRITDATLSSVGPRDKSLVATRLIVTGPSSLSPSTSSAAVSAPSLSALASLPPTSIADHASTAGLANSRETEITRKRGWAVRGAIIAAAALAVVAGVARFTDRFQTEPPPAPSAPLPEPVVAGSQVTAPQPPAVDAGAELPATPPAASAAVVASQTAPPVASARPTAKVATRPPGFAPSAHPKVPPPPDSATFGGRE